MTSANEAEIAIALQSARGTPAGASTQRSNVARGLPDPLFALNANPEVRAARIGGRPWIPAGAGGVGNDFELVIRPKIAGLLLYAALGAKAVSGASDPWTHTFTLANTVPWLTVWRHFGGITDERLTDCKISKLVISGRNGGLVTMSASIVGASTAFRTAQETAVAVESADPFFYRYGAGALLVEGVAFSAISGWTLTIDTGIRLEQGLGGPMPRMAGLATISLTIDHIVSDGALWKRMLYGSSSPSNLAAPAAVPLTLAGSPVGVQFTLTASASRSLRIALPQVALGPIFGHDPTMSYGPIRQQTGLLAYAPASGSPITATLLNSQSAY